MKKIIILYALISTPALMASEGTFTKDPTEPGGFYLYSVGEGFTNNLYYGTDYGETLQIVVADTHFEGGLIADATQGYLINHRGSIWLSRDWGVTWEQTGEAPYDISSGRIPGEMYAFDFQGIERYVKYSVNYGGAWTNYHANGLNANNPVRTVGVLDGEFYVGDTDSGWIYRSTDYGDNFTLMGTVPVNGYGYGTRLDAGALAGELYFYDGYTGDLFFSADSGISFGWKYTLPDTCSPLDYVISMQAGNDSGDVFFRMSKGYYTGGGEIYIWYSSDYGESFTIFHPFSTTVAVQPQPGQKPAEYKISCYPNPFNSTTRLTFSLPGAARVKLSIFDIQGRLVATLVDGFRDASVHGVTFEAAGLSSGVYLSKLEAGGRSAVQKMVLLK